MGTDPNKRGDWCPHSECGFARQVGGNMCVGHLPKPVLHDGYPNRYRLCLKGAADDGGVFDLQVCDGDLDCLRELFGALQGRETRGSITLVLPSDCKVLAYGDRLIVEAPAPIVADPKGTGEDPSGGSEGE